MRPLFYDYPERPSMRGVSEQPGQHFQGTFLLGDRLLIAGLLPRATCFFEAPPGLQDRPSGLGRGTNYWKPARPR